MRELGKQGDGDRRVSWDKLLAHGTIQSQASYFWKIWGAQAPVEQASGMMVLQDPDAETWVGQSCSEATTEKSQQHPLICRKSGGRAEGDSTRCHMNTSNTRSLL